MDPPPEYIVPIMGQSFYPSAALISAAKPKFANYLPDELLLEVLSYIPECPASQTTLARFCIVNKQWYNISIQRLYEAPYLVGQAYDLFVRTICPSVLPHIKRSELAGLGKLSDSQTAVLNPHFRILATSITYPS